MRTLSPKTVRNHLGTMHSVFELGPRMGWCERNPVKVADRPVIKTTATRIKFLEQAELEKLLAAPYPARRIRRDRADAVPYCRDDGLRQGELIGLRWRDVDLNARRVRVVAPYVRGEFGDPKSESSGRSLPLGSRVVEASSELCARSAYAYDSELVFAHPESGKPLDRSKLVRRFRGALERAGVRRITFAELRHTFGTRMAAAGVPLRNDPALDGPRGREDDAGVRALPERGEAEVVDAAFG